jgi:hypothetical protein
MVISKLLSSGDKVKNIYLSILLAGFLISCGGGGMFSSLPTVDNGTGGDGDSTSLSFTPSSGSIGTLITLEGADFTTLVSSNANGVSMLPLEATASKLTAIIMPGTSTGPIEALLGGAGSTKSSLNSFSVVVPGIIRTQQGSKISGTGSVGAANQGISVALSADGNTAIVGGYQDNSGVGAAWVYVRSNGVWSQQGGKLIASDSVGASNQGTSVALSADGNTASFGGLNDNSSVGAVWIFTRNNGVWSQQGTKLIGSGAVGAAKQGFAVSLSADGNTVLIGGRSDDSNMGAAWVFTRSNGVWSQQGSKLVGSGNVGVGKQGTSVSLSADGTTAIIGGISDNSSVGAAWVFTRSNSVWSQQGAKLVGTGSVGTCTQGRSVSLSADGNTAIIGGQFDNSSNGAVWVFTRSGSVWSQQGAKLTGTGSSGLSLQGSSVSLSLDGGTAIVGASGDETNAGAAWIFTP